MESTGADTGNPGGEGDVAALISAKHWQLFFAGNRLAEVAAHTKGEARAMFKQTLGWPAGQRLPLGYTVQRKTEASACPS